MQITCRVCGATMLTPEQARRSGWKSAWMNDDAHPLWTWVCNEHTDDLTDEEVSRNVLDDPLFSTALAKGVRDYANTVGGVFFAGQYFPGDDIQELTITVRAGDDVAETVIYERDIDKFQVQADHYSHGNVAQFVLDVFNMFVDRYET